MEAVGQLTRRHRSRLQQSPDHHHRQSRHDEAAARRARQVECRGRRNRQARDAARVGNEGGAKARRSSRRGCSPSRGVRRWSPMRLDMNRLVSGMLEMLRRTLGSDISIETVLGAGLWPTLCRRPSARERAAQSGAERQGRDAGWRLPDHRDGQHLSRRRLCAPVRRRQGRPICGSLRHRHRHRHPAGDPRPGVRAVLHHQAARRRARGSGLPWCMASSSNRAAMCASTARSAAAPR